MNTHLTRFLVAIVTLAAVAHCGAGTIITNNLPARTAIININARQDGAAGYNAGQTLWYRPFFTGGATNLLQFTVEPGTYVFRAINPADAAQLYPALTSAQTNQIFTAWTYNSPWVLNYLVFPAAAATNSSLPQLFDGSPEWPPYSTAGAAYAASLTNGFNDLLRVGPLGRASTNLVSSYTFTNVESLVFVIPDYILTDNAGGVSVLISPATTVPPTLQITLTPTNSAVVSWAGPAAGWVLEYTNALPAVAVPSWPKVPPPYQAEGGIFSVTFTNYPANGNRFFRLHKP